MTLVDILSVAFASIVVLVVAHLTVFWVVRSLYPPMEPAVVQVVTAPSVVAPPVVFTQPAVEPQQNVVIPTYETPIPAAPPSEEGERRGPPPPESTSIHRKPGVDSANPQSG